MQNRRWLLITALLLLPSLSARAYLVGPPVSPDDLTHEADLIFQGTAVSNTKVTDSSFQSITGFIVQETEFRPAFAIKGKLGASHVKFRHYAPDSRGMVYEPQSYSFEIGKSYLVFAKQPSGAVSDLCQQMWMSQTGMEDEGVLLCLDHFPIERRSMKDLIWRDLTELLKSADPKEVVYAITHLDELSVGIGGQWDRFGSISEFQRLDVLAVRFLRNCRHVFGGYKKGTPMKTQRKHTAEFKKQAVELLLSSDKTLKEVAQDLGIHAATLRTWRQQAMIHEPPSLIPEAKNGSRTEMERELRLLKEQLRAKDRACEILKKAIAICSESQGINPFIG